MTLSQAARFLQSISLPVIWGCFFLLILERNPNVVTHPAFWGEDGWVWFPDALHLGWQSVLIPHTGYFQTVSRLVALVGVDFGLRGAAAIYALCAVSIEALLPAFIASDRLSETGGKRSLRLLIALIICFMPNNGEIHANLTNSQWHLGALAFLIIIANAPTNKKELWFDRVCLTISSLSGPFCIFLLPIAGMMCKRRKGFSQIERLTIVAIGALIQGIAILTTRGTSRTLTELGADWTILVRMIASQIIMSPLLGRHHLYGLIQESLWNTSPVLPLGICVAAMIIVYQACRLYWPLRYAAVFSTAVFAASLATPVVTTTMPQWHALLLPRVGTRYFFLPTIVWISCFAAVALAGHGPSRALAMITLAATLLCGVPTDALLHRDQNAEFAQAARRFDSAPTGIIVRVPVRPDSFVELTK